MEVKKRRPHNYGVVDGGATLTSLVPCEMSRLLSSCGLFLCDAAPHHLDREPHAFVRAMAAKLKKGVNPMQEPGKRLVEQILAFMGECEEALTSCLTPLLQLEQGGSEGEGTLVKESLVMLLLQLEELQTGIFVWLMEKAALKAMDEDDERKKGRAVRGPPGQGRLSTSRLILSQTRWLNRVYEAEPMAEKVLEVLGVCSSPSYLSDLLGALSELVAESQQSRVAAKAEEIMRDQVGLYILTYLLCTYYSYTFKSESLLYHLI